MTRSAHRRSRPLAGLGGMTVLGLRTSWRGPALVAVICIALVVAIAVGVEGLYPARAQRVEYAATAGASGISTAFNGRGYALDTLGGITGVEVGFMGQLLFPILGVVTAIGLTRRQEEAGRTELLETLAGRHRPASGRILLDGEDVTRSLIAERIAGGMVLVPEDRQADGLVQLMSVGRNMSLAALRALTRLFQVQRKQEESEISKGIEEVRVKTESASIGITSLSGGNQQKVVIAKALMTAPRMLLMDEPTRGIDIGAKSDIFSTMTAVAGTGVGVLFATSELAEALGASTRLIVMARGRIVADLDPRTATRDQVMAATGEQISTASDTSDTKGTN